MKRGICLMIIDKRYQNTANAGDLLVSLARKLPPKLLVDAVNAEGNFTMAFLLRLNDEQLEALKKEAEKKGKNEFFLFFYTVPEEKAGKEAPYELRDFSSFDFSKVVSFSFNGSTQPLLPYRDWAPVHYVSVTFVIKN